jgi:hypothetical protein
MGRARLAKVAIGLGIVATAAGVVAVGTQGAGGATTPVVSMGTWVVNQVEGNSGTTTVTLTASLNGPSTTPVQVGYLTTNGAAKATDLDFVAASGTLTFAPGVTTRPIAIQVRGDTKLEDLELFRVKLTKPVGAVLGVVSQKVQILNDEMPTVVAAPVSVLPGRNATFKPKLKQRFYTALTLTAKTVNGTAKAPGDFDAVNTSITFAAGKKGPVKVKVPTIANLASEPNETFSMQAGTASGVLVTATGTIMGTTTPPVTTSTTTPTGGGVCPAGSDPTTAQPSAPSSPSSAPTLLPPGGVTGGAQWDVVFQDEFGDAAYTASKWSTGMRSGDRTLEGNTELEWYMPANSALTTDNDGFGQASVLRQTLKKEAVPGAMYTVRTLSRIYPPSKCPSYYDPNVSNSTSTSNTNLTRTAYQFTSGMLNNAKSFGFKYGYVETRVKMPKGFALWPALWLRDWGPWNYEIDAMEAFDRQARTFRTTWWGGGGQEGTNTDGGDIGVTASGVPCRQYVPIPATTSSSSSCSLANAVDLSAGYHTIGLNWTPTKYELYLDGALRWTSGPGTNVASDFNHLILNLALGNNVYEFDWTKELVKPFDANLFSSSYFPKRTVEWDYVRVWQPATAHNVCTPPACN